MEMSNGNGRNHVVMETDRENVFNDGELLKKVLSIILKENFLKNGNKLKKVINFKHPNELQEILQMNVSESGCKTTAEIEEIIEKVVNFSVKTTHPNFHNQLFGGLDEVALTGTWLLEALNTNQCTFEVAPVFVLVEKYIIKELCRFFGFKDGDGIFAPGGSVSNMYGITLGRYKRYPEVKENGLFGKKEMVLLTSDMSHFSIQKAASFMGFGTKQVVRVPTDNYGRMRANSLRNAIKKVKAEGREPFLVNATSGTTVFGAFDPLDELAVVCEEEGLWLHVDACLGGSVIFSETQKHLLKGIERADSISWNPHKMLCAPLQCSAFLTRHKGLLLECNGIGASYLYQQDKGYDVSFDTGDKSIQCGRKADAFKLWMMLKIHGLGVFRRRIDHAFEAASYLECEIERKSGFKLVLGERDCTNVCFWYVPPSLRNMGETPEWWLKLHKVAPIIKNRMVNCGTLLVGYQPVEAKNLVNFFRMTVTAFPIATKEDMDFVLNEIERLGKEI